MTRSAAWRTLAIGWTVGELSTSEDQGDHWSASDARWRRFMPPLSAEGSGHV